MTTLEISIVLLAACIAVSFLYGLFTRNYSTVDRLWSVLPPVYLFIWMPGYIHNPRYIIASILVLLWGARLTTNFAIKGGYTFSFRRGFTGEDYRWEVMRGKIKNRFLFELFNLFFISGFQLILIFVFTLPLYYYGKVEGSIRGVEIILYAVHLLLLALETTADIQQLRYYRRRGREPWLQDGRYRLGFNTFGLWKFSRHPNYICEFSQWVVVYLYFAVSGGGLHFSGCGALVLILLFAGSTRLAESITASKYPRYGEWKKLTSVWFPLKSAVTGRRKNAFLEEPGSTNPEGSVKTRERR